MTTQEKIIEILKENSSDANNGQMSVVTEDSYFDTAAEIAEMIDKRDAIIEALEKLITSLDIQIITDIPQTYKQAEDRRLLLENDEKLRQRIEQLKSEI